MAKKPTINLNAPEADSALHHYGGSKSDRFNDALIKAAVDTGWFPANQSAEDRNQQIIAMAKGLQAFKPADEIEGMLAAQAIAAHHAAMECARRAMLRDQPFEAAQGLRKAAANASRCFVELLAALDRKRGKGQVVRVERVVVQEGGQAIVGNVQGGGAPASVGAEAALPLAIGHDRSGITLDDFIGRQPELVGEGGV